MRLLSVNVAVPREVPFRGNRVKTGIFKEPVHGRVRLRALTLEGDVQADLRVHGGRDKAVYAYPMEHYDHWRRMLGRDDLSFGQFGENFTVEGMLEDEVRIGDAYQVGTAVIQVTQPRVPCFKLGIKMGSQAFLKPFLRSGRVGFYLRVLQEGEVGAGDSVALARRDPAGVTVADVLRWRYLDPQNRAGARRAVAAAALSPSWRRAFEERLADGG